MDAEKLARENEIMRVVNGSQLYGIATENSDRDEIGVCIAPPEIYVGFQGFEQFEYSTGDDNSRNGADDYDLTIYTAHKFIKLIKNGNPSLINLMNVPSKSRIEWSGWADRVMEIEKHIHCRANISKFLGYMNSQIKRLHQDENRHVPKRPEIVEKYGYDTKFAGHAIRLGIQGIEFACLGYIRTPMVQDNRELVLAIRNGEFTQERVIQMAEKLVSQLEMFLDDQTIPKNPNSEAIQKICVDLHLDYWEEKGYI